ncbi:MAG: hypothetical protein QXI33_01680 [Candidatus Pacearchaeota archaeon]
MLQKSLSLDEIIESEQLVILDTCCLIEPSLLRYLIGIYQCNQLNERLIDKYLLSYSLFNNSFKRPNVRTINEVSVEIKRPLRVLNDISKRVRDNGKISHDQKKLLDKLDLLKYSMITAYESSRTSNIELLDTRYIFLLDIIKTTEDYFHFKFDSKRWKENVSKTKRVGSYNGPRKSNDTDERLVAATLYVAMYSDKIPALVSRDADFIRMFREGIGIIASKSFFPYNHDFRYFVKNKNFRFYFGNKKGYFLKADNSLINWWSKEKIKNYLGTKTDTYFSEINTLWDKFNSVPALSMVC